MAKSHSGKNRRKKAGASEGRDELRLDAGGYDWGWPQREVVSANMELARRLGAAGFAGCAYGYIPNLNQPYLGLIGANLRGMTSALDLLREWVDLDGPNAINLEILVRQRNYTLSISQRPQLLRWRLRGIDSVHLPMILVTSLAKTLDTKNPFIDDLHLYSRRPVAPLWLTVGAVPEGRIRHDLVTHPQPVFGPMKDAIQLPGISVYREDEPRPPHSMIIEKKDREILSEPPAWLGDDMETPSTVAGTRERRLASSLAKTLHCLRRSNGGRALVSAVQAKGCATWQAEQAICNLRLIDHLPYEPKGKTKRLALIDALRAEVVEPASAPFDPAGFDPAAVIEQVRLDCGFLLRRVDEGRSLAEDLDGRLVRLRKLGYG